MFPYVLATCGSLLASDHRYVRNWGAINLLAALTLAWVSRDGFISLWCLWAAITSIAIAIHLRHGPQRAEPEPVRLAAPG